MDLLRSGALSDAAKQFDKFRADWEKTYAEPHKVPILENGTTYVKTGLSAVFTFARQRDVIRTANPITKMRSPRRRRKRKPTAGSADGAKTNATPGVTTEPAAKTE